jgi:AP-3 complex subunit mu
MMDHGVPFTTEPNILMEMIPPNNILINLQQGLTGKGGMAGTLPDGTLSTTYWRKSGVKYATNEIYFDLVETLDSIVDTNGMQIFTEVNGQVDVVCKLSGMPDLTLNFANPHILDDVSFHPCVRYKVYEQRKVISFVPPDGHFKLMNYR